ncbi:MAG: radical SAM protein [Candidatus Thermoplasmatota archaeon]
MYNVSILDGYIDEPTCLGVPPYISPYPRYIAGSIWTHNPKNKIFYLTIDQLRKKPFLKKDIEKSDILIVIAGMSVPGRYLSGFPASPNEISKLLEKINDSILTILCGPAAKHGFGLEGGKKTKKIEESFDLIIKGDSEIVISNLLENIPDIYKIDLTIKRKTAESIKDFAIKGAQIVKQHPFYPDYLIAEIETYRGCPRAITNGCSFCSESLKGLPVFRPIPNIVDEIESLYKNKIRHIRLGNQPCLFSYMAKKTGKKEFPEPNPEAIKKLFKSIRKTSPNLKTFHIDNVNPGIVAKYPDLSKKIAEIIVKYHTPGDTAAMGIESIDPKVIRRNNLKANRRGAMKAIKIINQAGRKRGKNGMPELLPGLNFVFGLKGETKKTYDLNYRFLKKILQKNLLLRRINLRQVIPLPNTKMSKTGINILKKNKKYFKKFKRKVNQNIQRPMLKKIVPKKTILKDVYLEKRKGKITFGRQIGSYPLLIGIPGVYNLNNFIDVHVVDYGYRSITAIPKDMNINTAPREAIQSIEGIGKKRVVKILANRPFNSKEDLETIFAEPEIAKRILDYFTIKR